MKTKDFHVKNVIRNKNFIRKEILKDHIASAHEGKKFCCEKCGKVFIYNDYLKTHIRNVHEEHKKYQCDECGETFSTPANLRRHMKTSHKNVISEAADT